MDSRKRATVNISSLKVEGFVSPTTGVANFLKVPYARIEARFRQAIPIDPLRESGTIDATRIGPCCPQPVDVVHCMTSHLYPEKIKPELAAEFSCLNLNIYTPGDFALCKDHVPVIVWIHGGGFTYGDGGSEYDGNYLVQHSISIRKPVVLVAINYRLGYHGFLSSHELKIEAQQRGEEGFANLGLHDQRLALQWVQKNIHFFGGNGSDVTCAGESAGAMSVLAHIRSHFPAFQRAFILSPATFHLASEAAAQETFDKLAARAGVSPAAPGCQKIDALRDLTPAELQDALGGGNVMPIWDENWFVGAQNLLTVEDMKSYPSWLKEVVIGSTSEETALFLPRRRPTSTECIDMIKSAFANDDKTYAEEVSSVYGVRHAPEDDSTRALRAVIAMTTDAIFTATAHTIATAASEHGISVYRYTFKQQDVFEGSPLKGYAYHSLGNPMLFKLPTVASGNAPAEALRLTSAAFCESAVLFANGIQPWEPYTLEKKSMMIFDAGAGHIVEASDDLPWAKLIDTKARLVAFKMGIVAIFMRLLSEQKSEPTES